MAADSAARVKPSSNREVERCCPVASVSVFVYYGMGGGGGLLSFKHLTRLNYGSWLCIQERQMILFLNKESPGLLSRGCVDPDHKPDVSASVHHSCEKQINLLEQRQQQKKEGSRRRREANLRLNHCWGSWHRASVSAHAHPAAAVGAVVLLTLTFDLPVEL